MKNFILVVVDGMNDCRRVRSGVIVDENNERRSWRMNVCDD